MTIRLNLKLKDLTISLPQHSKYPKFPNYLMGRGGGLVVSILAFYSDDPSLNPAGNLNFMYEEMKINEKHAGVGPSLKKFPNSILRGSAG